MDAEQPMQSPAGTLFEVPLPTSTAPEASFPVIVSSPSELTPSPLTPSSSWPPSPTMVPGVNYQGIIRQRSPTRFETRRPNLVINSNIPYARPDLPGLRRISLRSAPRPVPDTVPMRDTSRRISLRSVPRPLPDTVPIRDTSRRWPARFEDVPLDSPSPTCNWYCYDFAYRLFQLVGIAPSADNDEDAERGEMSIAERQWPYRATPPMFRVENGPNANAERISHDSDIFVVGSDGPSPTGPDDIWRGFVCSKLCKRPNDECSSCLEWREDGRSKIVNEFTTSGYIPLDPGQDPWIGFRNIEAAHNVAGQVLLLFTFHTPPDMKQQQKFNHRIRLKKPWFYPQDRVQWLWLRLKISLAQKQALNPNEDITKVVELLSKIDLVSHNSIYKLETAFNDMILPKVSEALLSCYEFKVLSEFFKIHPRWMTL